MCFKIEKNISKTLSQKITLDAKGKGGFLIYYQFISVLLANFCTKQVLTLEIRFTDEF